MIQSADLNKLIYDLGNAGDEIKEGAASAVGYVIEKVADTGRVFVPVDEGDTRDSIGSDVIESAGTVTGEAGPTTRHAPFVEWGTYKDAPQAFMGPALDRHSHELDDLLGQAGERAIDARGLTGFIAR